VMRRFMPWAFIGFGVFLRLSQYLSHRSLWLDEAKLALNIVRRPMGVLLLQPLDSAQGAPIGFLAIEKNGREFFG